MNPWAKNPFLFISGGVNQIRICWTCFVKEGPGRQQSVWEVCKQIKLLVSYNLFKKKSYLVFENSRKIGRMLLVSLSMRHCWLVSGFTTLVQVNCCLLRITELLLDAFPLFLYRHWWPTEDKSISWWFIYCHHQLKKSHCPSPLAGVLCLVHFIQRKQASAIRW